ncbi:unnamed protein product [Symbiodinium sp. CCMP2592]|nr:unnamed protein product [Symbiodinium sp. CCMP2592]
MDGLRAAMYPLPEEALPVVAVAFREASANPFPARLRQLLLAACLPGPASLSDLDAVRICEKLLYTCRAQQRAVGQLLTFDAGLVDAHYQVAVCVRRGRQVLGCMDVASDLSLLLRCDPSTVEILPILAPRHNDDGRTLLFVETCVLRYMSLAVVHWRASFDGFGRIWSALHGQPLSSVVRKHLFHAWLFWQAQVCLHSCGLGLDASEVPLRLLPSKRSKDSADAPCDDFFVTLPRLRDLLHRGFLERFARQHHCRICDATGCVGVDAKVSSSVRVCAEMSGAVRDYAEVGVSARFGCCLPPAPGSCYCRWHAEPQRAPARPDCSRVLQIPGEVWQVTCDVCSRTLPPSAVLYTRALLATSMRASCARSQYSRPRRPCRPAHVTCLQPLATFPEVTYEEEVADDCCRLAKPQLSSGARRTGGALALLLPCGTVCNISACAGRESATQVFGLLGQVRARRALRFVVYDTSCMLARFIRRRARRPSTSVTEQLADCRYVLDRFHRGNHTACVNPAHRLYLPEVRIEQYAELADVTTSNNEQFNNWLSNFQGTLRHMRFETMEIYLLLIGFLWNTHVVPHRDQSVPSSSARSPSVSQPSSLLKRKPAGTLLT